MKIRGYVKFIFYPKNGLNYELPVQWAAFKVYYLDKEIQCSGMVPFIVGGEYLEFTGEWTNAAETIFSVSSAVRVDDDIPGATNMLEFVFGYKTAAKILDIFKGDACLCWEHFKEHRDLFVAKASKVKGVGDKKISKAYEKWENYSGIDSIFKKFEKYGLNITQALKIFEKFGPSSLKKIEENPYCLYNLGLDFKLIDKIALEEYKLPLDNPERVYIGAVAALKNSEAEGHCYIRLKGSDKNNKSGSLKEQIKTALNLKDETVLDEQLLSLFSEGKLVRKKHNLKDVVYFPDMEKAEREIAKKINSMLHTNLYDSNEIEEKIKKFEKENFELDLLQKNAIACSLKNQFSVISGPPGAGKTTIIDAIISIVRELTPEIRIQMCSPTGKAAQRMKESTGENASTIHRLLEYDPVDEKFKHDSNNVLPCDMLIIDEFSMCGVRLFNHLMQAIPDSCHVILVGDKDQLPSIEPGKVLEDLLSIEFIPKTVLTKIYRQKEGSVALQYALAIGKEDLEAISQFKSADDLKFFQIKDMTEIQQKVISRFEEGVKEYGLNNVCIMTPTNKNELGTIELNRLVQEKINPQSPDNEISVGRINFRLNDRVIQVKNEPDYEVFNGNVGTIVEIIHGSREVGTRDTVVVDFGNDIIVEYNRDRMDNLKLAYALTIHKLQGSEYKLCLMILHPNHKYQLEKKLVYTGWTRLKNELDIFGDKSLIKYAATQKGIKRHSMLTHYIKRMHKV